MVARSLSTSAKSNNEASQAEGDHSGMDEDLLTQVINGPDADMDVDIGGSLQDANPAVAGLPEPDVSLGDRVSRITPAPCASPETRSLALVRLG